MTQTLHMRRTATPVLHGRDDETARLTAMLEAARAGQTSSLVVVGGAGVGKSALLADLAARAGDAQVLTTVGLESEAPLAFAALHRLLRPVLDRVDALPEPQRRALQVAFGQVEADRIDPFLVALATLSLLTEAAESGLVLCVVDDAHWLDAASADALLFAARRLLAEQVVLVFAGCDDGADRFAPTDVDMLHLDGLEVEAVGTLLRERGGQDLSDVVVSDLASRTGGNPLALVELVRQLSSEQLAGMARIPETLPLSGRVERTFLERCRRLSVSAQTLLLLAAVDDSQRLSVVLRAAEAMAVPASRLAEVVAETEEAGLLVVDGDAVRVRHPMVRAALQHAATSAERRGAHAALAQALGAVGEMERQVWHRAAACEGPDELVATDLEGAGVRSASRGGHDSAAEAFQRSAELTSADEPRARRLFTAARSAYAAGQVNRAKTLLKESRLIADDTVLRADIDRLRGRIEVMVGSAVDAHRIFIRAALNVADVDQERAAEMAALAGIMRSHGVDSGARLLQGAVDITPSGQETSRHRCFKLLVACSSLDAAGETAAASAVLRDALQVGLEVEDRDLWANLANMALHLGDDVAHRRYYHAMLSAARADGAVMEVLHALHRLALTELAAGEWRTARRMVEDAMSLARSIGQPHLNVHPMAVLTLMAALEGDAAYGDLLAQTQEALSGARAGIMELVVPDVLRWAQGVNAWNEGAPAEAFHQFTRIDIPATAHVIASSRMVAAAAAQMTSQVREWVGDLDELAGATGLGWASATAVLGRALVADPVDAPALFEAALATHRDCKRRFDEALTELAYGEHLRRAGRRLEARGHLARALDMFRDLGAEALVARTTRELRASGETARQRNVSTQVQLTPTELHIAQLVSQGLSNKDVAAQCWVSPRTVAFHLRNVFAKTGVTSRVELARLDLG